MDKNIMRRRYYIWAVRMAVFVGFFFTAPPVQATQTHFAPEGLYVHQMAHIMFIVAMVYLVSCLILSGSIKERAWLNIAISATLFALWNIDTFVVHWVREYLRPELFEGSAQAWSQTLTVTEPVAWIFYLGKLDHLLCVPAIIFFLLGLRAFNRQVLEKRKTT